MMRQLLLLFCLFLTGLAGAQGSHEITVEIEGYDHDVLSLANNVLDKQYITSGYSYIAQDAVTGQPVLNAQGNPIPTLGQEGTLTAFYGNPRQVFVTAQVRF